MQDINRRSFLSRSVQASIAIAATRPAVAGQPVPKATGEMHTSSTPQIAAFTKSFQDRPVPEVCRIFKGLGLDGLDLTVRPGGHIEPKDVGEELPKAVKAARDNGVAISLLTTAITDADADAERILSTAADLGIRHIKLGYHRYGEFGTLAKQMDDVRKQIEAVAELAGKYKVLPCIHIHSGKFIPSHGTMLYELIRGFSPQEVGAYVDALHMTLEGGREGWRQGLDLLAPWITLAAIKNFVWEQGERDNKGQMRWHTRLVPVADGICPIPDFVGLLKKIGFSGLYSLHSEYKGRHSFKDMSTEECTAQTAEDLKFFRPLL